MSHPVIQVEGLSKSYVVSHENNANQHYTLRDVLTTKARAVFGRAQSEEVPTEELFWALSDVSFDVHEGDRFALIGSNGAGKSTLLKILTRIVAPTKGKITIEGRVASLLEVGTGFHPELTGRENIFLNGAILGMSKAEIRRKFDEIVDFSDVGKFLDTPVKRFSSGMYVRLAFSVAANLESEILIVDEVLAVGDAAFQKKCIAKMQDISHSGRTILFVSHTMNTLQSLCNKAIYLKNGKVENLGEIGAVVQQYLLGSKIVQEALADVVERKGNGDLRFTTGVVEGNSATIETFQSMTIKLQFELKRQLLIHQQKIEVLILDSFGQKVAWLSSSVVKSSFDLGAQKIDFSIKNLPLAPGNYACSIVAEVNNEVADWLTEVLPFTVVEKDYYQSGRPLPTNQCPILLDYSVH